MSTHHQRARITGEASASRQVDDEDSAHFVQRNLLQTVVVSNNTRLPSSENSTNSSTSSSSTRRVTLLPENEIEDEELLTLIQETSPTSNGTGATGSVDICGCAAMVVNAALGAGMLNFPYAFSAAGGVTNAVCLQFMVIALGFYGMIALAKAVNSSYADDPGGNLTPQLLKSSYEGIMEIYGGKRLGLITKLCISLYAFGTCITFTIIIGDMIDSIFGSTYRTVGILAISPVLLILVLPRDISFLKHASIVGVIAVVVVTVAIVYETIFCDDEILLTNSKNSVEFLRAFPSICFAYQCHISAVPIYATSLATPSLARWVRVLALAFGTIFLVNSITGAVGFWRFGVKRADVK